MESRLEALKVDAAAMIIYWSAVNVHTGLI